MWKWRKAREGDEKPETGKLFSESKSKRRRKNILDDQKGVWKVIRKETIKPQSPYLDVVCAFVNLSTDVLALSFSNGSCCISQLSTLMIIHDLNPIHQKQDKESVESYLSTDVSSISLNEKGNWLAIGHKIG